MIRTFNIAVPAESRTLYTDAQGRAVVSYTTTNNKPSPARGRVRVVPRSSSREDWFAIDGEVERDFRGDEAHQFTVRVAIPKEIPAGTYSFRLDAMNVANPQEDFTEGDTVAVEWRPPPAPPPPRWPSWLIPAIVGAVAFVGLGIVLYLVWPESVPQPEPKPERFVLQPSAENPVDFPEGTNEAPNGINFAGKGRWLVIAGHNEVRRLDVSADAPTTPSVRLPNSREQIMIPSPLDNWLFTSDGAEFGQLWDMSRAQPIPSQIEFAEFSDSAKIQTAAFSADGKWLALGFSGDSAEGNRVGRVGLHDLNSRLPDVAVKTWDTNAEEVVGIAFTPDGRRLVTAGNARPPQQWEVETVLNNDRPSGLEIGRDQDWSTSQIRLVRVTGDGRWLIVGTYTESEDHAAAHRMSLKFWKLESGSPAPAGEIRDAGLDPHERWYLALSPDGRWLSAGTKDRAAFLWDLKEGPQTQRRELATGSGKVSAVEFDMDSRLLAAGDKDAVWLFNLESSDTPHTNPAKLDSPTAVHAVAFSPDRRWLAAACKHVPEEGDSPMDSTAEPEPVIRLWKMDKVRVED